MATREMFLGNFFRFRVSRSDYNFLRLFLNPGKQPVALFKFQTISCRTCGRI